MKITILGSGSKGNSTYVEVGNTKLLIDVGFSYKSMKEKLDKIGVDPKEIDVLLITHDHTDHTYGLKTFLNKVKPILYITKEVEDTVLDSPYEKSNYLLDEMILNDINIFRYYLDTYNSSDISKYTDEKDVDFSLFDKPTSSIIPNPSTANPISFTLYSIAHPSF